MSSKYLVYVVMHLGQNLHLAKRVFPAFTQYDYTWVISILDSDLCRRVSLIFPPYFISQAPKRYTRADTSLQDIRSPGSKD